MSFNKQLQSSGINKPSRRQKFIACILELRRLVDISNIFYEPIPKNLSLITLCQCCGKPSTDTFMCDDCREFAEYDWSQV
jgi:hypothetical protein